MVKLVITHKQGITLTKPRELMQTSLVIARQQAELNNWDGTMEYNGIVMPLRIKR